MKKLSQTYKRSAEETLKLFSVTKSTVVTIQNATKAVVYALLYLGTLIEEIHDEEKASGSA